MPYEDWPEEFQEVWDNMPVDFEDFSASDLELVEFMFEEGFMHYHGEISPEDISFAREEFWTIIGEEFEEFFDWAGWREAMGYDLWVFVSRQKRLHATGNKPDCVQPFGVTRCR